MRLGDFMTGNLRRPRRTRIAELPTIHSEMVRSVRSLVGWAFYVK